METLFTHKRKIRDLCLCPDNKTVTYSLENRMYSRKIGSKETDMGKGAGLRMLDGTNFIFAENGELIKVDIDGQKTVVKAKGSLVKTLAKTYVQSPSPNIDSAKVACTIGKVKRPVCWGEREYCGVVDLASSTFEILDIETFGGNCEFFPSKKHEILLLCALEVKGGLIHIIDNKNNESHQFIGMAPSISPTCDMVAFRKEGSITIIKKQGTGWALTEMKSQPDQGMGNNYNPPVWIDEETIVYDSGDEIYRFDPAKNNAKKITGIPGLAVRRTSTLVGPYYNGIIAIKNENGVDQAVLVKI